MAVIVEFVCVFGSTISGVKPTTICLPILRPPAAQKDSSATGQQYRKIISFHYARGAIAETPKLLVKIDRWILWNG